MGLDQDTRTTIDALAQEWVEAKKMFSAFEVSLAAKERGVEQRHRELKDYVHEAVSKAAEGHHYSRTLMDVGAPVQAWIYHPIADSPYSYVPLQRGDAAGPPKKKKAVKLRAPRELRAGSALPGSNEDGVYGANPDGSLKVPAELCKKAGITPGIGVVVEVPPGSDGLRVRRASLMELAEASVSVDATGIVVPMTLLEKGALDRLQGYQVDAENDAIMIRALED